MLNRKRVARIVARWTTELVVVFVGVYAAFAVAEWDEAREREERADEVRRALSEEIRGIQASLRQPLSGIPRRLAQMDSSLAAGTPIAPEPYLAPAHFRSHVWETTLASGGLALLDVESFYRAAAFYNEFNAFIRQIDQRRALSETQLVPLLGEIQRCSTSRTPREPVRCVFARSSRGMSTPVDASPTSPAARRSSAIARWMRSGPS